jgi:hypothetical protein
MYATQKTITIENGDVIPLDKEVYVSPRAIIHFVNKDPNDYVIMFFARGQDPYQPGAVHADVDMFLPAFDSRSTVAGLNLKTGECKYRVVAVPAVFLGTKSILPKVQEQMELSDEAFAFKADVLCADDLSLSDGSTDPIERLAHAVMRSAKTGGGGGGGTIHIG